MSLLLILAIVISLFFAFWNGFTDAANSISTIIATKVLKPFQAVLLAAAGNFTGLFFGTAVAQTIGKGIIDSNLVDAKLIIAVLVGGLLWDISTWFFALPISESHVLVGSLIGAGLVAGGINAVYIKSVFDKVLLPMVTSPALAFVIAFLLVALVARLFKDYHKEKINRHFKGLQILSSFLLSVSHGANDAQKAMGIITILLLQYKFIDSFTVPLWVMLASYLAISIGTMLGGWRIVKTMAVRITNLAPYQGFCAETAGALVLLGTALIGFPVSTTHAISGSIMGVGATRRRSAVRWSVARKIIWAWVLTMPLSALFSAVVYFLIKSFIN